MSFAFPILVAALVACSTVLGCRSSAATCKLEDQGCDGNVAFQCVSLERDEYIAREPCAEGSTCVLAKAGCGDSPGCLKHACQPGQGVFCDGNDIVSCCHDYESSRHSCAGVCVTLPGESGYPPISFCAVSATPDPVCRRADSFCVGNTSVLCNAEGFAIERVVCPAGTTCVAGHDQTICALNGAPLDCFSSWAISSFCDGTSKIDCIDAYPVTRTECAKGCTATADHFAHCNP